MTNAALELDGVDVFRGEHASEGAVVRGITLRITAGERVFLLGPNGAGKTSLLLSIVGAARASGIIRVGDTPLSPSTLDEIRRRVGFVFADPRDQFFLDTALSEVAFGPRQRGLEEPEVLARAERALRAVGLEELKARAPDTLSLGEQRRLAVATMLAVEPEVLLLDEPTASLDPRARRQLLGVIAGLSATVIVATHDLDAAYELGGRVLLLDGGRVVADGAAAELLESSALLESAGLSLPIGVAARRRDDGAA
jgi:cobalt/nickel transport system ATP-binding protein